MSWVSAICTLFAILMRKTGVLLAAESLPGSCLLRMFPQFSYRSFLPLYRHFQTRTSLLCLNHMERQFLNLGRQLRLHIPRFIPCS